MALARTLSSILVLLYSSYSPVLAQLRTEYGEQQRNRESTAARIQDAVNMICKHGQFIAPAFGASNARNVYLVDKKQRVFRYTDDAAEGVQYSDGFNDTTTSSALTCKQYSGFLLSAPYAWVGKIGSSVPCEDNNYLCEYTIEDLGLYLYKKPRSGSNVSRVFLANFREKIEVRNSGSYRRCDGYFASPAELRVCFGK